MDSDLQILERVSDAFVALDAQWRYTYVNGRAAELLGRPAASLVGRLLWDEFPEEAAPSFARACQRVLEEQAPTRAEEYYEPWDRWFENRIFPRENGLAVFFTDITEQKRSQALITERLHTREQLRRQEVYFRALTEGSADLVAVLEADGTIRYQNPAVIRVLGYSARKMTGTRAFDLIHPEDLAAVREKFCRLLDDPEAIVSARFRFRHRDGSWRFLEAEGKNLLHDDAVRGLVVNSRDVTSRVLAEEKLRESEERYRLVTRATNDVIWDLGIEAGRLYWGGSIASTFGYDPPVEGTEVGWWEERIHPGDRSRVLHSLGVAVGGDASAWDAEYRFLRSDGQYAVVHDRALIQRDPEGRPTRMVGSMQDLTRKREAETELRALFAAMQDMIFVVDRDGRYQKVAKTGRDLLYRSAQELLGRTLHETLPPRPADLLLDGIRSSLEEGKRVVVEYDLPVQGRQTWFSTSLSPMAADTVLAVARDVTASKQGEEALRKSEAWFRSLTQNALDITAVVDARGRIRYATASGGVLLGYEWAELQDRPLLELVHTEDQEAVAAALERLRRSRTEPLTLTVRVAASDGSWQVHQAVAQSLLHDPAVRGIVINSRDITEQWRLEAQLRQAQKMEAVGRLAGGVAHDFNNMLMAITGFAALLEGEIEPSGAVAEYLTEVYKAADRAASLTRQLLAFGRKQALRPKVLSLNSVVEGAGAMLRRLVREDVELALRLDPRLGACRVDPHQVEQVLMNLVVNATDALPEGGTIEISTRNRVITERDQRVDAYLQPGSYVALVVRDTGHGMDADTLAKIFEPFFTTKEVGKGTGLGLSTVYGIIKQSGGYISVESEPGTGSTFTVLLPRLAAGVEGRGAGVGSQRGGALPAGRGTILLAEDEEAVRLLARLALQKAGYTVLEARDGIEALGVVDEHRGSIDLLLTDVIMPQLGGYGLAQRLREIRPELRVIYMSGYAGNALREAAPYAPPGEFLSKPVPPQELIRKVRAALAETGSGAEPARMDPTPLLRTD